MGVINIYQLWIDRENRDPFSSFPYRLKNAMARLLRVYMVFV